MKSVLSFLRDFGFIVFGITAFITLIMSACVGFVVTIESFIPAPDPDSELKGDRSPEMIDASTAVYLIDDHKFLVHSSGGILHHPDCDCFKLPLLFPDPESMHPDK